MVTSKNPGETPSAQLATKERSRLRARAHALKPVVWVAESGITQGAMREIDRALNAHELIKIHSAGADRTLRSALLTTICAELNAQPVQVIGKMLVAFRARPELVPERPSASAPARRPAKRLHGAKVRTRTQRR
jgi:RNA-binding protein